MLRTPRFIDVSKFDTSGQDRHRTLYAIIQQPHLDSKTIDVTGPGLVKPSACDACRRGYGRFQLIIERASPFEILIEIPGVTGTYTTVISFANTDREMTAQDSDKAGHKTTPLPPELTPKPFSYPGFLFCGAHGQHQRGRAIYIESFPPFDRGKRLS